ncbi:MAG: CheB methylesterase domain-containing protein [Myxococcales bacterium]
MPPSEHWQPGLVAIGASTGGPAALLEVLGQLPSDFSLPIVVVVHIAAIFGDGLADWLDAAVPLEVRIAEDRAALGQGGRVWLAPADRHLRVVEGALRLDSGPERHSCRPSVDTLFESVATEFGPQAIGALLTGMGRDGAQGLLVMRRAGGVTIAQDEPSSVVFGMPREAITIGAAREVLPLSLVGPRLVELAPAPWRRRRP